MFYRTGRVPEVRSVVSFLLIVVSATQLGVSNHGYKSFLVMFCGTVKDTDPRYFYSSADLDNRIRRNTVKGRHEQEITSHVSVTISINQKKKKQVCIVQCGILVV